MKTIHSLFFCLAGLLIFSSCKQDPGIITIENDFLSVRINPYGAELYSIYGKAAGKEYLWQGDTTFWGARAPIMFPVNVKFKNNQFTYKGVLYDMPSLGVAVDHVFTKVPSKKPGMTVLELVSDKKTLQYYPFHFRLGITYQLEENTLINKFVVENTGDETMFFALGGHPGFNCLFDDGLTRKDYQYSFPEKMDINRIVIYEGLVQKEILPFLENQDALNLADPKVPNAGMFLMDTPFRKISIGRINQSPAVTLDLGSFPNVNLWSPPGKPYACIEPMLGHHDFVDSPMAIEEKSYLVELPVGESRTYSFTIIIN